MVLGYHVIFTMYGFWLPNDPRGSRSDFVRLADLYLGYGGGTKTSSRRSVAHVPHDAAARRSAKRSLRYSPVVLSGLQARAVARGFARAVEQSGYTIWACAIMPDHVHLVVGRHPHRRIEQIIGHLKKCAMMQLLEEDRHPFGDQRDPKSGRVPSIWGAKAGWTVYLNAVNEIERCMRYVEQNPIRDGLKPQRWSFVAPFDPSELSSR